MSQALSIHRNTEKYLNTMLDYCKGMGYEKGIAYYTKSINNLKKIEDPRTTVYALLLIKYGSNRNVIKELHVTNDTIRPVITSDCAWLGVTPGGLPYAIGLTAYGLLGKFDD